MSNNGQKAPLLLTNGDVRTVNKGGSPTLYTPATVDRLLAGLADGLNITQACAACGISPRTLIDWRERYPDLEPRLTEARETARRKVLAMIKSIGEETNDWRALDTWLQRSFPADYRRDSNVSVTATANAASAQQVIVSPEKRRELQERLARLQAQMAIEDERKH
jgi:DNA-binding transcriptional MerR regulator